jgi:pimeloyl-ACP methyl ester carboxylesterase
VPDEAHVPETEEYRLKSYMLIHGAWHGAWSYDQTGALLEQAGARVITFDLPGHGEDKTQIAKVTMQAYVDRVKQELSKVTAPVVLVGHSMAGFIVSQAAEELPDRVEKLIFIAAMVPYGGKTVFDEVSEDSRSELLQNLVFAEDKSSATVSEETLKTVVYNGATAPQIQAAAPKLVPQATQPFFAAVTTTDKAFGQIEKAYIVCEKDKIFSSEAQRRLMDKIRCSKSHSIATGHVPHVENPAALANAILSL